MHPLTKMGFVVKMRQGSLYFKLVILFNFLLIHSTLTAPLVTSSPANDINQNDATTFASLSSPSAANTPTVSDSGTTEISHVIMKQELDNNKEINDKTGTLSYNKSNTKINKKNYDNDDDTVNEIEDDEETNYEKNYALSNDNESSGSSTTTSDKWRHVGTGLSEMSTAPVSVTPIPTTFESISERPMHVSTNRSENIPLIIFETQNKSDPETYIDVISDKDTTIEITLTSDEDLNSQSTENGRTEKKEEVEYESRILSTLYTTRLPPAPSNLLGINNQNEDEIKIKTTDKDSDTVFFISNTEVKMMESNPTPFPPISPDTGPQFNPISSIEDVVIDFAYNNASSFSMPNPMNIEPDIVLSSLNTYENEYTRENVPLIRAPDSSYQESLTINFQDTPQYVSRLVKDSFNVHINTPTNISLPSNLTKEGENDLVLKNLSMPFEQFGGNTTIFLDADANSIFSGLDDFQTVVVACLLTLIPLILLAILAIAIRCIWQKYHRDYDTGSVLLGEYNSECHQNAKPNESITVDIKKHQNNAVTTQDDTKNVTNSNKPNSIISTNNTQQTVVTDDSTNSNKCPNNCTSRNGSIIKMTMQNNHLIVETEERNDISRDARETKLSYTSPDKDGIFIVAATRGADQLESLKTNNILKAKQDEKCELHDRVEDQKKGGLESEKAKEEVQIHSPPDLIQPIDSRPIRSLAKTGLTQSDTSLNSTSDSNQNYSYGTQVAYRKTTADVGKRHHPPHRSSSGLTNGTHSSQLNGSFMPNCNHNNNNNGKDAASSSTSIKDTENNTTLVKTSNDSTSSKQVTDTAPPPPLPDVVV